MRIKIPFASDDNVFGEFQGLVTTWQQFLGLLPIGTRKVLVLQEEVDRTMLIKSVALLGAGVLVAGGGGLALAHSASHSHSAVTLGAKMATKKTQTMQGGHHWGWMGMHRLMPEAAKALGISESTLRADLKAGQTLSQIASSHGSSATALEQSLIKSADSQIQKAETSGKISATEATKMKAMLSTMIGHMVTNSMRHRGAGFGFMGVIQKDLASALHVSPTTLRSDLKAGQSLATIAKNQNISLSTLEGTLVTDAKTAIQSGMKSGKLTATEANHMQTHLTQMVDTMVTKNPMGMGAMSHGHGWGGSRGYGGLGSLLNDAAKALNVSNATLKADLKSGKSLATVAQASGLTPSQLTARLSADVAATLQAAVKSGKLSQSQATTRETAVTSMITQFLSGSWGPQHGAATWGSHS